MGFNSQIASVLLEGPWPRHRSCHAKNTIEFFHGILDEAIPEGLTTLEKVEIRLYRSGPHPADSHPDEPAA
jgi:hypothetical protein